MALSRWSHSEWYIYEVSGRDDEPTLCIQNYGYYSLSQISNLDEVLKDIISKDSESTKSSLLELKLYLKSWRDVHNSVISFETYSKILQQLRRYGNNRYYLKYGRIPDHWKNGTRPPYKERLMTNRLYINDRLLWKRKEEKSYIWRHGDSEGKVVTMINEKEYNFRNKKMYLEKGKLEKYQRFLFEDEPIIPGEEYYISEDGVFFNVSKRSNPLYFTYKKQLLDNKILKMQEIKKKIEIDEFGILNKTDLKNALKEKLGYNKDEIYSAQDQNGGIYITEVYENKNIVKLEFEAKPDQISFVLYVNKAKVTVFKQYLTEILKSGEMGKIINIFNDDEKWLNINKMIEG